MTLKLSYTFVFVLFLITLFLRIVLIDYYDPNLGGIESNVVYGIQRILMGQPLYQDPASGAFAIIQYTPLWYYSVAGAAKLISHDNYRHGLDVQGIYVLCRELALVCNLLTVCVCAVIIRGLRFSWLRSFVFAMPVLIVLTSHYYTRGDSLHLLLFVLSIFWFIRYSEKGGLHHFLLTAFFSAACIMTKQSGALVAGTIGLSLFFIEGRYFVTVLYLMSVGILSILIAWFFNSGEWHPFYQNAVLGLKNGVDTAFLYRIFFSRYFIDLVPCYLLGGIILFTSMKRSENKTYRLILLGMSCSWIFAVATGLKIGSSNNYFTEFLLLLFIALPYFLQTDGAKRIFIFFRYRFTVSQFAAMAFLVITVSKTAGLFTAVCIDKSFKNNRTEYADEQKLYAFFQDSLHIQTGEHIFFTERRYLDNIFAQYSIMPTKDVVTQVYATDHFTFNYSGFMHGGDSEKIKYIVTAEKRDDINVCNDSLPFIWFEKSAYKKVARISGYSVYAWSPDRAL